MLYKKILPDGRVRELNRPSLFTIKESYVRPPMDFSTSMTIWHVDEAIKRRVRDWRRITDEDGHTGERAEKFRADHDSVYTGTYSVFPLPLMEMILIRYAQQKHGALILEGYPIVTGPQNITWGEVFVGPLGAFLAAGFEVVHSPSKRRRVVRMEF